MQKKKKKKLDINNKDSNNANGQEKVGINMNKR